MIAIGNGERCPFCVKIMQNGKIDGQDTIKHLLSKHPKEANKALFSNKGVGL